MFKRIVFVLLCFALVGVGGRSLFAMEFDGFLRVGLEQYFLERPHINVYSQGLEVGMFESGHFHSMGVLGTSGHFTARPSYAQFAQIPMVFATLFEAQAALVYLPNAIPAQLADRMWGLFVSPEYAYLMSAIPIEHNTRRIELSTNGEIVLISEYNLQLRDFSGITDLGVRQYRGVIELSRFRGENITAVNIIHMDEYLISVVPSEMPALWHIEAVRAQAVAARTFTLHRRNAWAGRNYDLCDTVFSQVYSGVAREHPNSTQAVFDTTGLVILHEGRLIEAVYSSCAGGFTANSEDVWVTALPFLRSVQEIHTGSPNLYWSRTITLSQINQILANNPNVNIGHATHIELVKNDHGRVLQLIVHGQTGTHTVRGDNVRVFFASTPEGSLRSQMFTIVDGTAGWQAAPDVPDEPQIELEDYYIYIIGADGKKVRKAVKNLASTNGDVDLGHVIFGAHQMGFLPMPTAPEAPLQRQSGRVLSNGYHIHLEGRGWGHGVGMSQHGARAMAEAGYNFKQILMFYYTGVEITYI
ncbi:MAG: SpoIID/LytB domain-containing protein [Defluviitaleaceae bacterium]|nr:SpoIID/LytB domain-containing protein [Defluviitaleaceae bacterium]